MATEQLQIPTLDPRNEAQLVEGSLTRVYNASGGRINDFSSSSVVRVLSEGLCFAAAELLYYVNQLPDALAIAYLKIAGIERRLGTAATVDLTFSLTQPLSTPFTIPSGFVVANSGGIEFTTRDQLVIPAGGVAGAVAATCTTLGVAGNLPAYSINQISQPLSYLGTVINVEEASGGTDEETLDEVKARGLAAIRRRNLVSADDYANAAIEVLGAGSVAHVIGLLGADKISYQLGGVHLFCLNPNGQIPNATQLTQVQQTLNQQIQVGTSLHVSAIELFDVDADLVAQLQVGEDPNAVANSLWEAFQDYLAPTKFQPGAAVVLKEVEYNLRLSGGISTIHSLKLNDLGSNLGLPYPYSLPSAHSLYCTLVDDSGTKYQILLGKGEEYL